MYALRPLFHCSADHILGAMPAEIFPSSIRAKGVAWSTMSNWFCNFIIGLMTPPLIQGTRGFGAYTFFAFFCFVSLIWGYFCVPETRGRSLEDMDHVFGDHAAVADRERRKQLLTELRGRNEAARPADNAVGVGDGATGEKAV